MFPLIFGISLIIGGIFWIRKQHLNELKKKKFNERKNSKIKKIRSGSFNSVQN